MSLKRVATDNMDHNNWDKEDPSDKEKAGVFKTASKETLEKRVLRHAKRRFPSSSSSSEKGVFSTFAGFNKPQPSSFDFLANLTNGTNTNGSGTKSDTAVTSSLFTNKPTATPSSECFGTPLTGKPFSTTTQNTLFSSKTEIPSMTFSSSKADSTVADSPFKNQSVSSSADTNPKLSTGAQVSSTIFGVSSTSPNKLTTTAFKQPESSNSGAGNYTAVPIQSINKDEAPMEVETDIEKARNKYYSKLKGLNVSVSSWIVKHVEKTPLCFLTPIFKDYENYLKEMQEEYEAAKVEIETKQDKQKPVFDITDRGASSFMNKSQDATSTQLFGMNATSAGNTNKSTGLFEQSSTASLTESASKTTAPTKGFTFETSSVTNTSSDNTGGSPRQGFRITATPSATEATSDKVVSPVTPGFSFGIKATPSATAASLDKPVSPPNQGFSFGMKSSPSATSATPDKAVSPLSQGFSFGMKSTPFTTNSVFGKTNPEITVSPPSKGFSFGVATTPAATPPKNTSPFTSTSGANTSSPVKGFSFGMTSTPAATSPTNSVLGASTTSFSFGSGVPFSFSTQTLQSTETQQNTETKNEEEEDQPPKVEFTPVVEENSVFDKKCKIFVKKDGSYVDKGVGTLYIKKIQESGKYQLLVRANTNLGTVLVNLVLTSAIPMQRMGKNNVMLCTPPPDTKTPPTPVLIRVKTGEADELLETLNKYKS